MTKQTVRLEERTNGAAIGGKVDRAASLIRGCKILGPISRNNRRYLPEAIRNAAPMYERRPINVDHSSEKGRSYRDRIGMITNVRMDGDSLRADLQINPKHPLAEQLFWDAENMPAGVGLSHVVEGITRHDKGVTVVEQIERVHAVDLVADPATTNGLYEGIEKDDRPELDNDTQKLTKDRLLVSIQKLVHDDSLDIEEKTQRFREILKQSARAEKALVDQDAWLDAVDGRAPGDQVESFVRSITNDGDRARGTAQFVEAITMK